jgi:hypothetical protein
LLFLRVSPATIWERGIGARTGEQFIEVYARKFGKTREEIHQYFVREQETLADLFSRSTMPKLQLQNDGAADVVDVASRFWTEEPVQKELAS